MASSLWTPSRRLLLAGAGLMAAAPAAFADGPALLRGVSLGAEPRSVRLSLALSRPVSARTFFLDGPQRFVVDLPDTQLALPAGGEGAGAGVVLRYRYAPRPGRSARVVFDLAASATLARQEIAGRAAP